MPKERSGATLPRSASDVDAAEIEAHLVEVADILLELDPAGPVRRLVVAGGSLLAWIGLRDATRDVDSVEPIAPEVAAAAAQVAIRHDLSPAWLNDSSRGFLPQGFTEDDCRVLLTQPRLLVLGISDQMAFLMKINAARAEGSISRTQRGCGARRATRPPRTPPTPTGSLTRTKIPRATPTWLRDVEQVIAHAAR